MVSSSLDQSSKLLSDVTAFRTYARFIPHLSRRETLDETFNRSMHMHLDRFPKLSKEIIKAFSYVHDLKIASSMRSLQFAGDAVLKNHSRSFNCSFLAMDDVRSFGEVLFLLLSGCGVGISVQKHHIINLPVIRGTSEENAFIVHDSIIGWAMALDELMDSYFFCRVRPIFDFTQVRPKGSYLVTTGARAPGPEPLKRMLIQVENKLKSAVGRKLRSIEVHDIVCMISDCVLAGGVRRCLPEGSPVHAKRGLIPIEDIQVGEDVLTTKGYRKVKNKFSQGKQKIINVITQNGTLRCTSNHRVAILTDVMGGYQWIEAGKLKEGDLLYFGNEAIDGSATSLPEHCSYGSESAHTRKSIAIPELTADISWLLGYFHGNGYVYLKDDDGNGKRHGHISLAVPKTLPEAKERIVASLQQFGVVPTVKEPKNDKCWKIYVHSVEIAEYFSMFKTPGVEMTVPGFIKCGTISIRSAYVAGFFDANGSASSRPVCIASQIYPKFLSEVQHLCSSLGFATRLKLARKAIEKWKALYHLNVCNKKQVERFIATVGSFSIKQPKFVSQKQQYAYCFPSEIVNKSGLLKRSRDINTSIELIEIAANKTLPFTPVRVKSIEEAGTADTWDIEIDEVHEFFTNGYLVHNSALISLFDRNDDEMLQSKSGRWWEHSPWRARANNSVVLPRDEIKEEEFRHLFGITKNSGSGEPGFSWTNDKHQMGFNPSLREGTRVWTQEFGMCPIEYLEGKEFTVKNLKGQLSKAKCWLSGANEKLIEIVFCDGMREFCTEKHEWPVLDGDVCRKIAAKHLTPEMKIARLNYQHSVSDGEMGTYEEGLEVGGWYKNPSVPIYSDLALQYGIGDLSEGLFSSIWYACSDEFINGFIDAFLIGDSHFQIDVNPTHERLANEIQQLFGFKGIFLFKTKREIYTYKERTEEKHEIISLNGRKPSLENRPGIISEVNLLDVEEKVWDIGVEDETHCFQLSSSVTGNCHEISLMSGQVCNLTTINVSNIWSTGAEKEFLKRAEAAAILGTIQATYTDFPYLTPKWKKNTEEEALLGVSMTGIADNISFFTPEILRKGAQMVLSTNERIAKKLGINLSARSTTLKPEGTTSVIFSTSSGIHDRHAPYYIRRIRMNKDDALTRYLKTMVPDLVEDDVTSPTGAVVSFPQKSPGGASIRDNVSAISLFDRALLFNENWVIPGHRSGPNYHNVSCTISVREDEWDVLCDSMWKNRNSYSGVSLLPYENANYAQMPFEACSEDKFNEMTTLVKSIDLRNVLEFEDNTERTEQVACSGGVCSLS